ncbi:MAG: glycogen/starch/alpha-glucan phosphorylase [Clostridiales bacterium]|nr:glycogen/starch/alpha-glucan phosphorylase [Clostridiales bacterium]
MTSEQISLNEIELRLKSKYQASLTDASVSQMHDAISEEAMESIAEEWFNTRHRRGQARRAYYFSAEYMMGRMLYNNLYALGLLNKVRDAFLARGMDIAAFEEIEDAALGNGGLGRLAACYLDSAATHSLPLDGYGLRYKFGLFKQSFRDGFQVESADDWQRQGDPWSIRRDTHSVQVEFLNQTVHAIPYDMPVIGYRSNDIATLRLWQSEPMEEFDFQAFNDQQYDRAVREKNAVEDITRVLYPNDSTFTGKQLRLKQQYFLSSASLQDIIHNFKRNNNGSLENFKSLVCVQLNDTHPVVSIPELVRLLMREGFDFDAALDTARHVFSYTNHTVMAEALEKWDVELFKSVIPHVFDVIYRINARFCGELLERGVANIEKISIIQETTIHMANLAGYCCRTVNGVARIHTEILKHDVLKNFYNLYPDKFINITNGVTQRRWLALCNPELSGFITRRIGDGWIKDLSRLSGLKGYLSDADVEEFNAIKRAKKRRLSALIEKTERVALPPHFVFDVQVKRMHEYKRQLMNAFSVLDTYYGLKEGRIQNYMPTAVIFGAKAAPGYWRAKGIIKFIQDIAAKINADPAMNDLLKMVFVTNYNCSYAEHIIPAADVSEQISPAGTEASGTGNMKLMLNGAVTLGTYDGATVEIVEEAGAENNFIFGKSVAELNAIRAYYNPYDIYNNEPRVRRLVDALVDGTFGKLDIYTEIHDSLLSGNYGMPDRYFVLLELMEYIAAKERVNAACRDSAAFGRMCLMNTAGAGKFSSDRAVGEYAGEIWHVRAMPEA